MDERRSGEGKWVEKVLVLRALGDVFGQKWGTFCATCCATCLNCFFCERLGDVFIFSLAIVSLFGITLLVWEQRNWTAGSPKKDVRGTLNPGTSELPWLWM